MEDFFDADIVVKRIASLNHNFRWLSASTTLKEISNG